MTEPAPHASYARRVVLVGCGHAHLEVLRKAAAFRHRGADLVLIDPGRFWYSGRGGGLLGGRFTAEEASIDPADLAARKGATFIRDAVTGIDRDARRLHLASGRSLAYDLASFAIGSTVERPPGFERAVAAKPIEGLFALSRRLAATQGRFEVCVVGGGPSACEIAGNLLHLRTAAAPGLRVTLACTGGLLPGWPEGLRRRAAESLSRRGARIVEGVRVEGSGSGSLRLASGALVPCDLAVLATGLRAPGLMSRLDLPIRDGGLAVGADLVSIGDSAVFAAGDCAALEGFELDKAGVYGVRAGPILAGNLLARLDGRPLRSFRPQKRYLSILDLGDGEALARRGRFWLGGAAMLAWKLRIDARFLDRHRG